MKLTLRLRFHTRFGQTLLVCGNHPLLGNDRLEAAVELRYLNHEFWEITFDWPDESITTGIRYRYLLRNADGSVTEDFGDDRLINPAEFKSRELLIVDAWNDIGSIGNVFHTEPFRSVLLRNTFTEMPGKSPEQATHTFKVKAPLVRKDETLCLLGDGAALGNWQTASPLRLNRATGENWFVVQLNLGNEPFPLTYKYGVYDEARQQLIRFEDGEDRQLHDVTAPGKHTLVNDGFARLPATTWKGAGVAIPVFSLRTESSFGVGEFTDLKLLTDWGKRTGLKLIQILPINDTIATHSWLDSYPYAAISAFALHPLYLNLSRVATGNNKKLLMTLEPERKRLNALEAVDYEAVMCAKLGFIKQIFPSQRRKTFTGADYRTFFEQNKDWLVPYAVFSFLRDKFGTADFSRWPAHRTYQPEEVAALLAENAPEREAIDLHFFIQFHLHLQLREATDYAHANGLILKGDIAIGVFRFSADVWQHPELYHLDMQAGAPPDAFAVKGQNWGFPTYNWARMKEDGFTWWKQRFEQMSRYFDAFRIDHILGFFRIWSIPTHAVEGIMGRFVPAIPVSAEEFGARQIPFDRDRYAKPFITDSILEKVFAGDDGAVKQQFLIAGSEGRYSLRPEFATQRQVEIHFSELESTDRNARIREGLFDLISNVILFEVEETHGPQYHFRFGIEATDSFKNLPLSVQAPLRELYVDYFFRRQDSFWMREALEKLPALKRVTNMLVCGEDLGLVPDCVPQLMKQLGLLSLEIQRMPKQSGSEFFRPHNAPYLSVVTPSTHDMSTIRGWWEEDPKVTRRFFNQELGLAGRAPAHCDAALNRRIVEDHLASPAMWSIFQLQDLLGSSEELRRTDAAAERINVPANPKNYWRYRMHLPLETLLEKVNFNSALRQQIESAGR